MPYSFNTSLMSALKTGYPNLIGTSLSGGGVNIISLSTNDVGITFNAKTPIGTLTNATVGGSVFGIDTVYHGDKMALINLPSNNISTYTIYTHNSALAVAPASAMNIGVTDVIDANGRRKWVLGYI